MIDDVNKLIYGEEYYNKQSAFIECLNAKKEKHKKWFNERKEKLPEEDKNFIFADYTYQYDSVTKYMQFSVSKDLPTEIQEDFAECFRKHWGS